MLPVVTKKRVYNAMVLPHLDYCSVVWQECTMELRKKVERIQNYGMQLILSKSAGTPSDGLRQELRWLPLERRREMFRLFLVHRRVMKRAPLCLGERLRTNEEMGNRMTRGSQNLFVPAIHRCQPRSSSWRDINCNIVGLGAGRRDRKPFPRLRGITDWIRDFQLFA